MISDVGARAQLRDVLDDAVGFITDYEIGAVHTKAEQEVEVPCQQAASTEFHQALGVTIRIVPCQSFATSGSEDDCAHGLL